MITIEQAKTLDYGNRVHENGCKKIIGPRGGVTYSCKSWRVAGRIQLWKTRPNEFRLPIKFGLRSYDAIDSRTAHMLHLASECPVEEMRGY